MATTITDVVRMDLFAQVLEYRLEHPESTVQEACEKVGVPRRTFYAWLSSDSEAMLAVKDTLNDSQRASLFEYSQRLYTGLTLLLDDFIDPKNKPEVRMKLGKWLIPFFDDVAKIHHATPGGEDRAPFLKDGPKLERAQSRLATLDLAITEDGVRVEVLRDEPLLELEARDPEPAEKD